jgi:hypothetical protein
VFVPFTCINIPPAPAKDFFGSTNTIKSLISIHPHHQLQSQSEDIEYCGIVNVMVKYWY